MSTIVPVGYDTLESVVDGGIGDAAMLTPLAPPEGSHSPGHG